MAMQNGFRSHILQLIADERAKRVQIEKQLNDIDIRIAALETTLAIYEENLPTSQRTPEVVSVEELKSNARKIPEALKFIAKRSGGIVHYGKARDLIIAAGLSHGKARNVGSHIYNMMKDGEEWKKVGPGTFRLIEGKRNQLFQSDIMDNIG